MANLSYPYSSIVFIDTAEFSGSGVLISPDEVLTASHLASPSGVRATNIEVFPGTDYDQGPAGKVAGLYEHALVTGAGGDTITYAQSQNDFAVIHLAHPVIGGTMTPFAGFRGGAVTVSGYPGESFHQVDDPQTVTLDPSYSILQGTDLGAGSSGGPVWFSSASGAVEVVGVVSSANTDGSGVGNFAEITPAVLAQIDTWVAQDDYRDPLVDQNYYYAANPDVLAAAVNAAAHYQANGWHEGRNPDAFFSTVGYLAANPDVAAAGVDPAIHYDQNGWREGRDPGANFNTRLYLLQNPDVAAAGVDPLAHYLAFGQFEGRAIGPAIGPISGIVGDFDREYYLLQNPDVARAGVDPLRHFLTNGWHEGRDPNPFFDTNYYLQQNPDVAAAGGDPLLHYEAFGWHEGRNPSAEFNTRAYLAHSPDIAAAGIDPLQHYLDFGIYEGRAIV